MKTTSPAQQPTKAENKVIRVAIVEDDEQIRESLAALLRGTFGYTCTLACQTAEEAIDKIPVDGADVVVMDLRLPGMSGFDCIRALRAQVPDIAIMVLTSFTDPDDLFRAIRSGASGYFAKPHHPSKILDAITEIHNGGAPMTPGLARRVLATMQDPPGTPEPKALSERERQVLRLAASGRAQADIAKALGISYGTVRTHFRNIFTKLQVHNVTEALIRTRISA